MHKDNANREASNQEALHLASLLQKRCLFICEVVTPEQLTLSEGACRLWVSLTLPSGASQSHHAQRAVSSEETMLRTHTQHHRLTAQDSPRRGVGQ